MLAARMIPVLWIRLIALVGFTAFMVFEGIYWLAGLCVLFVALSVWQLVGSYKQKAAMESEPNGFSQ